MATPSEVISEPKVGPPPDVLWTIYTEGKRDYQLPESSILGTIDIVKNSKLYQVLMDEPGFFMWRWIEDGYLVIFIKKRP